MKVFLFSLTLLVLLGGGTNAFPEMFAGVNLTSYQSAAKCGLCTLGIELVTQYTKLHSQPISDFVKNHLCNLFSEPEVNYICKQIIALYGDDVIEMMLNDVSSDDICHKLPNVCTDPTCRLHQNTTASKYELKGSILKKVKSLFRKSNKNDGFDPWAFIDQLFERFGSEHLPVVDQDGDLFSTFPQMRGNLWRGMDCNDFDPQIYPGRKINANSSSDADHDCNGIYGTDPATNRTWEDILCGNSTRYGIALLGDSVGAHFSIPPEYLTAAKLNLTTYSNVLPNLFNEFDRPHESAATGFSNSSAYGPVRSIYKYLRDRNRCNHRDLQNIGVNGATIRDTASNVQTMRRNQTSDHPLLVIMEVIGNDVCGGPGGLTDPEQFKQGVLDRFNYFDTILPPGSHILMFGLVNGSFLFDNLHNEIHPIGVTYAEFYDYLTCMHANPCTGWLTRDSESRRITTEGAMAINAKYREIIAEGRKYKNFDYAYYEFPVVEIVQKWIAQGGKATDLMEPIDGFHSNQLFNALIADWGWQKLNEDHPDWIGEVNPNNEKIIEMFGDQGGYF